MVFVFNEIPRFKDDNGATAKKMMVLQFNRVYSDKEKDVDLLEKLTTEENKSAFVKLAVDAMLEVMERNMTFTMTDAARNAVEELVAEGDQFQSYLNDIADDDGKIDWMERLNGQKASAIYDDFKKWAQKEGYNNILVQRTFTKKMLIASRANCRRSHGERYYVVN